MLLREAVSVGDVQANWRMAMLSHVGRVRARNEDFLLCDESRRFAVLADGMGGHAGGAVASRLAVAAWVERIGECETGTVGEQDLLAAVDAANRAVFLAACEDPGLRRMGTTLVGACFRVDGILLTCHVGDSRLYRLREGVLDCLTRDHSVLREQCDAGMIQSESSGPLALRGLLTRAVGVAVDVMPDVASFGLRPDDVYLLCSDGLTEMLPDADIADVLGALGGRPRLAVEHLIDLANDRGGMDNISALVVAARTAGRLGAEFG
jgi:PPM family protein phosphatase